MFARFLLGCSLVMVCMTARDSLYATGEAWRWFMVGCLLNALSVVSSRAPGRFIARVGHNGGGIN